MVSSDEDVHSAQVVHNYLHDSRQFRHCCAASLEHLCFGDNFVAESVNRVMVDVDELSCDESGYMIERIRVSDTGIGMSQDYLKKIFEAFTREKNTTKSKIAGTGLGMSIVKKYVDLLGGTVVEDEDEEEISESNVETTGSVILGQVTSFPKTV